MRVNNAQLLSFLVTLPILLASLVLHELAHGGVAAALGDPTARLHGRLTLNPLRHLDPLGSGLLVLTYLGSGGNFMFGYAKPVPVNVLALRHPQRDMMLVGAAGPATNLCLAVLAAVLMRVSGVTSGFFSHALLRIFVLNIILAAVNLLPVPPLDGSRIVGGLLPRSVYVRWTNLDRYATFGFLAVMVLIFAVPGLFTAIINAAFRVLLPGWTYA
jgi:Zn-dependent protease